MTRWQLWLKHRRDTRRWKRFHGMPCGCTRVTQRCPNFRDPEDWAYGAYIDGR